MCRAREIWWIMPEYFLFPNISRMLKNSDDRDEALLNLCGVARCSQGFQPNFSASRLAQIQKGLILKGLWLRFGRSGVRLSRRGWPARLKPPWKRPRGATITAYPSLSATCQLVDGSSGASARICRSGFILMRMLRQSPLSGVDLRVWPSMGLTTQARFPSSPSNCPSVQPA